MASLLLGGTRLKAKVLSNVCKAIINLFDHNFNAKLLWFHSNTRWWSNWEVLKQESNYFGDVLQFLEENVNLSHATRRNLLDTFENPQDLQDLLLKS